MMHVSDYHGLHLGEVRVPPGGDFYRTVGFVNYDRSQNLRSDPARRLIPVIVFPALSFFVLGCRDD
jgi:hypothetical protein